MKVKEGFSTAGLDTIKVGDLVAPIHARLGRVLTTEWTGVLLRVTKVTEKRFCVGARRWVAKDTGCAIGRGGGGRYVLATEEMIAEVERRNKAKRGIDQKAAAFRARPDYRYANNIWIILDEMTPDNHPLDRLTVDEWTALYRKLAGKEKSGHA